MRKRADLLFGLAGLAVSSGDLWLFSLFGLDLAQLASTLSGAAVLGGFVAGYAGLGFVIGRLWNAQVRATGDAKQIRAQLDALERSREAVVQSEKLAAIGALAAGIAHEVRNPLGVIRASASMLADSFEASTEEETDDHRACRFITEEIDRLDGLIGALLAFAKPSSLTLSSVDVDDAIERALQLARELDVCASTTLATAPAAVPPVRADRDLLTQVLLGLCVNAAEVGAERITIEATSEDGLVRIDVSDDGPGVPEIDRSRVFDPFFTTKKAGTGLGLPMAARIVAAHGGALTLVDVADQGARFRLTLPIEGPRVLAAVA